MSSDAVFRTTAAFILVNIKSKFQESAENDSRSFSVKQEPTQPTKSLLTLPASVKDINSLRSKSKPARSLRLIQVAPMGLFSTVAC